ncbi:MAG TPA: response regulator [Methanoregula sp.]|nr:response regulator [Methanoregula sp.]
METNSEPSRTDEEITGEDNALDIFILCKDDRDSQQLIGQLTPAGYRITLFTDSSDLITSLREGKPNLLICDTTGPEQDGYNICREIKSDDDLWRIPVLLVTGMSNLGDLLVVLDSNADNFIARPYNHQFLLSLVDMMLTSPVEKPDPTKVKTQFKIRHEDRDYVIAADRRKLLEFLLSTFEMAVGRASEQRHTQRALDNLRATLERQVTEKTAELTTEAARLQTLINGQARDLDNAKAAHGGLIKEMETLRSRLKDHDTVISSTKDDLSRLTQELENTRARLAEAEDTVNTLTKEKDELEQALRGDADAINRDLEKTRTDLLETKKALAEIVSQREVLESQFAGLKNEHEESERALGARIIEIEQLKSSLTGEKNRADSAELEVKSILSEKARSEQDLRQMVEDITEKAKQQSQECLRLSDELAAEKEHRATAEQQSRELVQEAAKKDAAFVAQSGTLRERHDTLQQKYDMLTESLGAERQKSATFEADIARITAAHEKVTGDMQALKEKLDVAVNSLEEEKRLRATAETNVQEITRKKEEELQVFNTTIGSLRQDLENTRTTLLAVEQERDASEGKKKSLDEKLTSIELLKAESDKLARSIEHELEQTREELETERRMHRAVDEKLAASASEKENLLKNISSAGEQAAQKEQTLLAKIQELSDSLAAEQEAHRVSIEKLARTVLEKETAEKSISAAGEQAAEKEQAIHAKIQGLSDSLAAEQEAHRVSIEKMARTVLEKETAEKSISAAGEQAAQKEQALHAKILELSDSLAAEQEARRISDEKLTAAAHMIEQAEEHLKVISDSNAAERGRYEEELRTALARQRSLEEQLREAEQEQVKKETESQLLSTDLEQAGADLAAEKERRHAAEEECGEVKDALATLRKRTQVPAATIEEIPVEHHVMISKGPELPRVIAQEPLALFKKTDVQEQAQQPTQTPGEMVKVPEGTDTPQIRIQSIEDLFEEAKELDVQDLPDANPRISGKLSDDDNNVLFGHVESDKEMAKENQPEPSVPPVPGHGKDEDLFEFSVNNQPGNYADFSVGDATGESETTDDAVLRTDNESGQGLFEIGENSEPETSGEFFDQESTSTDSQSYQLPSNIGGPAFGRQQWFDLMKWAHNTDTLSRAERIKIVKLGRMLQQGRRISGRQEAQLEEIVMLARARGYQPKE